MTTGIDVSTHNGVIDWKKVKDSGQADFAIIRAGYGRLLSQKDKKFDVNYQGCKENHIPVGTYWYSYAVSVPEILTEAEIFLEVIKEKQFAFPVYLDFEESAQFALGKAKCSEMAEAFLNTLENAGYFAGLYSSKSHLEQYFTEKILRRYTIWLAHYGVVQTSYPYPFAMWQYTNDSTIAGISGHVDKNYCYQNFPAIIQSAGLNGFQEKNTKHIVLTIDGKTYSGTLTET